MLDIANFTNSQIVLFFIVLFSVIFISYKIYKWFKLYDIIAHDLEFKRKQYRGKSKIFLCTGFENLGSVQINGKEVSAFQIFGESVSDVLKPGMKIKILNSYHDILELYDNDSDSPNIFATAINPGRNAVLLIPYNLPLPIVDLKDKTFESEDDYHQKTAQFESNFRRLLKTELVTVLSLA